MVTKQHILYSSAMSLALLAASGAHAQQAPPTSPAQSSPAPTSASQPAAVAEVIVTAQRRAQRLQDVPIAVSVVSATTLATLGVTDVTQLNVAVPGVMVRQSAAFELPYIRGVGSAAKTPLDEPQVGFYVDDVYIASQTNVLTFNNIKDVQVDKGPQGTLFGRNTTGGVISVTTSDPSDRPTADFHVGYGNYEALSGDAYVSGAIANNLTADLAVVASGQGQGYGKILTGDYVYQNDYNYGARSKFLFTPDSHDRITVIADFSDEKNSMSDPGWLIPGSQVSPGVRGPTISSNPYDIENHIQPVAESMSGGLSLNISHDFDSGFQVKSITAYRQGHEHQDIDADVTAPPLFLIDGVINDREFTEELQAQSTSKGPFTWTAGLYYFNAASKYDPNQLTIGTLPIVEDYHERFDADSIAGYVQGTYAFTPDTHLTLGARYTDEWRDVDGVITEVVAHGSPSVVAPGVVSKDIFVDKPSYRATLDHDFSSDLMVYASYNSSFKSGGFSAINAPAYLPETLDAYEVGMKSELLDRRVMLNLAAFYYDYHDIQVQQITFGGTLVTNAGAARTYGLDADLKVQLAPNLNLTSGVELLSAKYTAFPGAPFGTPLGGGTVVARSAEGNYLPFAPQVAANLGLVHTMQVAGGQLKSSLLVYFSSRYYTQPDNIENQGAYATVNGSILWQGQSGISVKLWADNLTNQLVIGNATDSPDQIVTYNPPRTFGVTFGYKY